MATRKIYKRLAGPVNNVDPELERMFLKAVDKELPQHVGVFPLSTDKIVTSRSDGVVIMQFWTEEKGGDGDPLALGFVTACKREMDARREDIDVLAKERVEVALRCLALAL